MRVMWPQVREGLRHQRLEGMRKVSPAASGAVLSVPGLWPSNADFRYLANFYRLKPPNLW